MKIVKALPPNWPKIKAVLDVEPHTAVFTYGDTIYNPAGGALPDHLIKHEETHMAQQLEMGVEAWWDKYLASQAFRLSQELEAYQVQAKELGKLGREERRKIIPQITKALSSPMYGSIVSRDEAKALIGGV